MSLNRNWNDKIGYIEPEKKNDNGVELNLYKANCLIMGLYEKPSTNEYWLAFFFNDNEHMKRCLKIEGFTDNWKCVHIAPDLMDYPSRTKALIGELIKYVDVRTYRNPNKMFACRTDSHEGTAEG